MAEEEKELIISNHRYLAWIFSRFMVVFVLLLPIFIFPRMGEGAPFLIWFAIFCSMMIYALSFDHFGVYALVISGDKVTAVRRKSREFDLANIDRLEIRRTDKEISIVLKDGRPFRFNFHIECNADLGDRFSIGFDESVPFIVDSRGRKRDIEDIMIYTEFREPGIDIDDIDWKSNTYFDHIMYSTLLSLIPLSLTLGGVLVVFMVLAGFDWILPFLMMFFVLGMLGFLTFREYRDDPKVWEQCPHCYHISDNGLLVQTYFRKGANIIRWDEVERVDVNWLSSTARIVVNDRHLNTPEQTVGFYRIDRYLIRIEWDDILRVKKMAKDPERILKVKSEVR
ncbi:MAG: hypothetical protein ACMUHB_00270 [Thermoplasmatota archaeon]